MKIASAISRNLLDVIFLAFGLNGFLHCIPMPPPTGIAAQFFGARFVSRLYIVIFLLQILPAILLLVNRYVLLALTILGPVIFNISLLSHFRGASRLAVGSFRHHSLDTRGFERLASVQGHFAALRGTR